MRHLLNAMKQREQKANEKTTEDQLMMQRHLAAKIGSGRLASKKTQQVMNEVISIFDNDKLRPLLQGESFRPRSGEGETPSSPASAGLFPFPSVRKKLTIPKEQAQPPGKWSMKSLFSKKSLNG